LKYLKRSISHGCRVLRPNERDVMGQHWRTTAFKKSKTTKTRKRPSTKNITQAPENQGLRTIALRLWDGCDIFPYFDLENRVKN
jgi:hypothetical protein